MNNFIPISSYKIISDLLKHAGEFDKLFKIIEALYQYNFSHKLQDVVNNYQVFNPDLALITHTINSKIAQPNTIKQQLSDLLINANYTQLSLNAINSAINSNPHSGLNIEIDLVEYEELLIFVRGQKTIPIQTRKWQNKWRLTTENIDTYTRLFILIKLKNTQQRAQELNANNPQKAYKKITKIRKNLPENSDKYIFLKLFKNIPVHDLEMLLPLQKIKLKLFDKLRLIITSGAGAITGIISAVTKLLVAALNPITLITTLGGVIAILIKQITNIFNQRTKYMMNIASNLYFKNLANNFGVITSLVEHAKEEELKEVILGYYFLSIADKPLTIQQLDAKIENYIQQQYNLKINFEIEDGIQKLEDEKLLINNKGLLSVVTIDKACVIIDKKWDNLFNYN